MKTIKVVAAVICDSIKDKKQILATARGYGEFKGQWEFPGGKIEKGETPQQALVREIKEELEVNINVGELIDTIEYDYPAFHLSMDCFWAEIICGQIVLKEAEDAKWLTIDKLNSVKWLPADVALISCIKNNMRVQEMSDECMTRAIAILDTVFKSIESLGGSINSDLSVKIRGDIVRFRMVESQDQVKHEMTKQEAQALVKYNDDIKNHRWASKPQIRKYDKVYNGKLRIVFGERSYIRDNDSEKLEDRLGDILVTLYEKAEENRIVREAREEAERKRVEEARRREENRQRKEQEIRLVKELVNKAEDYRIAKEIREYIQAMIDSGNEDITPEWIEWALKKADWYDPSIATEDEYLGKRQHEKSAEEKEKSLQDSIRKSWYW